MSSHEVKTLVEEIQIRGSKLHAVGDLAVKTEQLVAKTGNRRAVRNRQSAARACRAAGTACEAALWLLQSLSKAGASNRVMARTAEVAARLTEDLEFEACVAANYQPEDARRSRRG